MNMSPSEPPPGLQGNCDGACVACSQPTDTALAFWGAPQWHIAALMALGLDQDLAATKVLATLGLGMDDALPQEFQAIFRVCRDCASHSSFPEPVLDAAGMEIPRVVSVHGGPQGIDG